LKKLLSFLSLLVLIFVLVACGNSDSETSAQSETKSETESKEKDTEVAEDASSAEKQAEYMEEKEKETENDTKAEDSGDEYSFEGEYGTYNLVGMYYNDATMNSDDGTNLVEFDGFNLEYVPTLVDIIPNEEAQIDEQFAGKDKVRAIMMAATGENTNEFDVDYNGDITVVTDTKEQLNSESGVFSENPIIQTYMGPVVEDGVFYFFLKDQESEPKHLKVMFEPPYKVEDGAVDTVNGVLGKEQTVEFDYATKEEIESME